MRQMTRPFKDYAPSKWRYRWQRWMLTPGVRTGLRVGTPILLATAVAGLWFAQPANRAALGARIEATQDAFRNRPEFVVKGLSVDGADEALADMVTRAVALEAPVSSFDIDLEALRSRIVALDEVAGARLRLRDGGTLQVSVTPRVPVAVWRTGDGLRLIDAAGIFSGAIEARADRRDLPLIAGQGAESHIDEALMLFRRAGPVEDRVRGLVRRGARRWDMVLDGGQRILLPADAPGPALDRVMALQQAQGLLDRDVEMVDVRLPGRLTARVTADAVTATRNAIAEGRVIETGGLR